MDEAREGAPVPRTRTDSRQLPKKKKMEEIQPGIYLATAEEWQADQVGWHDSDGMKQIDFSEYPVWVVVPESCLALGYDSEDEARAYMEEMIESG